MQGKGCPADPTEMAPAEIPTKPQENAKSVDFKSILAHSWPSPAPFFIFPLQILVVLPPRARSRAAGVMGRFWQLLLFLEDRDEQGARCRAGHITL